MGLVRDLSTVAAGPVAGVVNKLGARKVHKFKMVNLETKQELKGQFGPIDPGEDISVAWQQHTTLGRQNPILQFLHGNADTFSFTAFFFSMHQGGSLGSVLSGSFGSLGAKDDKTPEKSLDVLRSWARVDNNKGRPPRVSFTVGDGKISIDQAVITALGRITYFYPPKESGGIRGVTIPITLLKSSEYSLETFTPVETRYHRVKTGEYYELITYREYGSAILGDVIRKRHPDKQELTEGDVVKLPSIEAIRTERVEPKSIPFYKGYTTKTTATKQLRQEVFERNDFVYYSAIVPAGL